MDSGVPEPPRSTRERGIVYWFRPTIVPVGGAPLNIRQRWIGVPLPVRRPRPVEDTRQRRSLLPVALTNHHHLSLERKWSRPGSARSSRSDRGRHRVHRIATTPSFTYRSNRGAARSHPASQEGPARRGRPLPVE
jgi:hypothetical protein